MKVREYFNIDDSCLQEVFEDIRDPIEDLSREEWDGHSVCIRFQDNQMILSKVFN